MDLKKLADDIRAEIAKTALVPRGLTVLTISIFFLIALGGWVRNMGAGLACPDWPLCFGKLIPQFDIKIFAEFFHRLIAGVVSILFLILVIKITINKSWRALLGRLSIIAIALLASQIVLGGLTVLQLLKSETVTLHLATGTMFFVVVLLMALRANRFGRPPVMYTIAKDKKRGLPTFVWRFGLVAFAAVYFQILLGGMVASNYAGLACPDFPTCLGEWWPGLEGAVGIQILHRIGALITLVTVGVFAWVSYRAKALPEFFAWLPLGIAVVLIVQIALGICNVIFRMPVWMSVGHLAVAQMLLALILIATYEIRHFQLHQPH